MPQASHLLAVKRGFLSPEEKAKLKEKIEQVNQKARKRNNNPYFVELEDISIPSDFDLPSFDNLFLSLYRTEKALQWEVQSEDVVRVLKRIRKSIPEHLRVMKPTKKPSKLWKMLLVNDYQPSQVRSRSREQERELQIKMINKLRPPRNSDFRDAVLNSSIRSVPDQPFVIRRVFLDVVQTYKDNQESWAQGRNLKHSKAAMYRLYDHVCVDVVRAPDDQLVDALGSLKEKKSNKLKYSLIRNSFTLERKLTLWKSKAFKYIRDRFENRM